MAKVDAAVILKDVNPLALPADSPPGVANYREADLSGICCAHCVKFRMTGHREEDGILVPTGVCDQWEAYVDGVMVSDGFVDNSPAWDTSGNEVWSEFSASEALPVYNEIHFAGGATEKKDGKVLK